VLDLEKIYLETLTTSLLFGHPIFTYLNPHFLISLLAIFLFQLCQSLESGEI
jgi:hypothetical protein